MAIKFARADGEICEYKNAQYLPAFFLIPEDILKKCGKEIYTLPRTKRQLLYDADAVAMVESDLFRLVIIDAIAYMVWPFMRPKLKREIYSGYEPSWILAHQPDFWIRTMVDLGYLPTVEDWIQNAPLDEHFGFVDILEVHTILETVVPATMERYNFDRVLQITDEYRCFEDFDTRYSLQKSEFKREWYHKRTKKPMISLESFREDYAEQNDGAEWDVADPTVEIELYVTDRIQVEQFMKTLNKKDIQILEMRMFGLTLEEIANKLGYKTHTGILKRIRKIGRYYEKFAGVDYGFSEKKII